MNFMTDQMQMQRQKISIKTAKVLLKEKIEQELGEKSLLNKSLINKLLTSKECINYSREKLKLMLLENLAHQDEIFGDITKEINVNDLVDAFGLLHQEAMIKSALLEYDNFEKQKAPSC